MDSTDRIMRRFLRSAFPPTPNVANGGNATGANTARGAQNHGDNGGPAPLLQQYLMSLFGGFPGVGGPGALPGQMGDYALNGEG